MAVHRSTHAGCAGVQQAACAAGYRYSKGDVCHEEVECKAFSYECTLCQPGEECDSNYNVETEKGEDYDCKQNLWSGCYFLWPIAWIFFYLAIRQVNKLIEEGNKSEAKFVWIKRKSRAVWKSTSENLVSLHAIEQTQLRRKYRVDGVGRPKFDFHTGRNRTTSASARS